MSLMSCCCVRYGYKWKRSEADANLLRTHTTAVSAQMLYRVAQQKSFKPIKLFSIDRVFRNETMDATHLAEFHQVEGVVADYNLSLGDLIGVITEFFKRMGITQLRFKPAYNPYTEPSMEIFGYHPQLKKWTEIGNSGTGGGVSRLRRNRSRRVCQASSGPRCLPQWGCLPAFV